MTFVLCMEYWHNHSFNVKNFQRSFFFWISCAFVTKPSLANSTDTWRDAFRSKNHYLVINLVVLYWLSDFRFNAIVSKLVLYDCFMLNVWSNIMCSFPTPGANKALRRNYWDSKKEISPRNRRFSQYSQIFNMEWNNTAYYVHNIAPPISFRWKKTQFEAPQKNWYAVTSKNKKQTSNCAFNSNQSKK